MMVVTITVGLVGFCFQYTSTHNRIVQRQREVSESFAAADGVLEYAYAVWKDAIRANSMRAMTTAELKQDQRIKNLIRGKTNKSPAVELAGTGNTFTGFNIEKTDPWGETPPQEEGYLVAVDGFPGWKGSAHFYKVSVTATGPKTLSGDNNVEGTVCRYFTLTQVPIFQAAIFYMDDLEIHPGGPMPIHGLVHSNGKIWASANGGILQFFGNVSFVKGYEEIVSYDPKVKMPPFWADGKQSASSTEKSKQLSGPVDRMEPFGLAPQEAFNTTDDNPNNDGFHELIEVPVSGSPDPKEIADQRLYNKATLKIEIDSSEPLDSPKRIKITDSHGDISESDKRRTKIIEAIDGSTTIYDWREGNGASGQASGYVKVTSVDIQKLNTALDDITDFDGVLYVRDIAPGKNAIRIINGSNLSRDLTIASEDPIYVQGDYNTGWGGSGPTHDPNYVPSNNGGNASGTDDSIVSGYQKKSAAIIADAIVVLSNNWNDANSGLSLGYRTATNTTINAAMLCGIVQSLAGKGQAGYSGGAENFPRLLEAWYPSSGRVYLTYYGSMVQAFFSKSFVGKWQGGQVYSIPYRPWHFDPLFTTNPPPGSTTSTVLSRGRWERL
jgi:hypothetical protein